MSGDISTITLTPSAGKGDSDAERLKFYGVSTPNNFACGDQPLVFTSKSDALAAIKKYNGARFMAFASYEEAVKYGSQPLPSSPAPTSNVEEKSPFKSLIIQQMVALRKTIETGDEVSFLEKVWSNPRYLINCAGDGPTILQEGTRYNALHVAAKFRKTNMCLTVLNTLHDVGFISKMYPSENSLKIKDRIKRLVDLYINTPDKSLSETPLHFACKYGAEEILSVLLSFPECDINKRNKYGMLAREMVCDRVSDSHHLKEKMLLMFEDLFYVPILRDVASNIQEPVIGKPCRSDIVLEATSLALSSGFLHGKNTLVCCAFAGPMSQSVADDFYKVFSKKKFPEQVSFTPEQKKQLVDICLSDSEKGLERVGRALAKQFGIGWIEFWPKLNFWGDLSSTLGLEFLDNHLKNQYEKINSSCSSLEMEARCENFTNLVVKFVGEFVKKLPQFLRNKNKMTFFVLFQSLLPYIDCMSKSSFSDEEQLFLIHNEIGQLLYWKLVESDKEGFSTIKFYINTQFIYIYNFLDKLSSCGCINWRMFLCILKYVCFFQSANIEALKSPVCDCNWIVKNDSYTYNTSLCYNSIVMLKQNAKHLASNTNSLKSDGVGTSTSCDRTREFYKYTSFVPQDNEVTNLKELIVEIEKGQSPVVCQRISDPLDKNCDLHKIFEIVSDRFCATFCSLILNYSHVLPLSPNQFFDVFKQVMLFFKPLCEMSYSQVSTLSFRHSDVAVTLLSKMPDVAFDILDKWRTYFKTADFYNDLSQFGVTSTREWLHLFCVIKYFCFLLDDYACSTPLCACQFESDCKCENTETITCSNCLKCLQNMCEVASSLQECNSLSSALEKFLAFSPEEGGEVDEFFTPPESPPCEKTEVFVDGMEFSDVDIDILRAVIDGEAKISQFEHPHVFSWKRVMESKLGPLLKPGDKLSCTPSSSSASVRRAVMPKKGVRRTLF